MSRFKADRRKAGRLLPLGVLVFALLAVGAAPAGAQSSLSVVTPIDSTSVGRAPYSRMRTLLEKTLFKVDVVTVDIWLGDEVAARLEERFAGSRYSNEVADSVADLAIRSQDAFIRVEFLRGVSLDQFLDGVDDNLKLVRKAGVITEADYEMITAGMPVWYAFLAQRGIRDGDVMRYRIRGDTLRTQFLSAEGELMLDQVDIGPERRRSVLGSYFVRSSDFREGLVKSLLGEDN